MPHINDYKGNVSYFKIPTERYLVTSTRITKFPRKFYTLYILLFIAFMQLSNIFLYTSLQLYFFFFFRSDKYSRKTVEGPTQVSPRWTSSLRNVLPGFQESPDGKPHHDRGGGVPVRPQGRKGRHHRLKSGVRGVHLQRYLRRSNVR